MSKKKTPMELKNDAHEKVRKAIKALEGKLNSLPCETCSVEVYRDISDPEYSILWELVFRREAVRGSDVFRFYLKKHDKATETLLTQVAPDELFAVTDSPKGKKSPLSLLVEQIKDQRDLEESLARFHAAQRVCENLMEGL